MTKRANGSKVDLKVGDFTRRDAYDGQCSARVVRKTGPRCDDVESHTLCRTDEGAKRLAALMNAAHELARDWRLINDEAPFGLDPEQWVRWLIVKSVATAIDGPAPELPAATGGEP